MTGRFCTFLVEVCDEASGCEDIMSSHGQTASNMFVAVSVGWGLLMLAWGYRWLRFANSSKATGRMTAVRVYASMAALFFFLQSLDPSGWRGWIPPIW